MLKLLSGLLNGVATLSTGGDDPVPFCWLAIWDDVEVPEELI